MPTADVAELPQDDERFHGTVSGRELFELLKMLHRTCASGVLHLDAGADQASLCLDRGSIRAAFFNHLAGSGALSRVILLAQAAFRFELGTAHSVASYTVNIAKDTALILAKLEPLLDEHLALEARAQERSRTVAGSAATSGPITERIANFTLPAPGTMLGACQIVSEIGRGACSVVYRARHSTLGLDVVVKVLLPASSANGLHSALSTNEARLLARLNHPNILRIFDFKQDGPHPHLVMEYVDGPSLAALITRHQRLEPALALPLFCQAVEALGHAHDSLQLVHCDLKPSNILLTRGYQVKIADFGLAKADGMGATSGEAGTVAGTPAYIAPEQVEGGRAAADHRSDIYALGATMYQALTGRLPFLDPDPVQMMVRRLSEAPIPPHLVQPKLDRRLSQLVMSMMARDPDNRIQTCEELLELGSDLLESTIADGRRAPVTETRIIRRRTSFWNYVPDRLFRKGAEDGKQAAG